MMEPQRLHSRMGWEWIKRGYVLFMKAPILWIVILAICVIAMAAISSIPVVGEPLVSLLMPVVLVGLMAGCRALEEGEELELVHLFSGFKKHTSQLITLGGIALVSQYLILAVMIMLGGTALVGILMSGQPENDPAVLMHALEGAGLALLTGLILFILLIMAMQFAPVLVFFTGTAPLPAMKLSLRAFLVNIGPMLVYGLTFLFLAILASIPMMLGWLILLPLGFTSLYASYCDLFPAEGKAPPATVGTASVPGDNGQS